MSPGACGPPRSHSPGAVFPAASEPSPCTDTIQTLQQSLHRSLLPYEFVTRPAVCRARSWHWARGTHDRGRVAQGVGGRRPSRVRAGPGTARPGFHGNREPPAGQGASKGKTRHSIRSHLSPARRGWRGSPGPRRLPDRGRTIRPRDLHNPPSREVVGSHRDCGFKRLEEGRLRGGGHRRGRPEAVARRVTA